MVKKLWLILAQTVMALVLSAYGIIEMIFEIVVWNDFYYQYAENGHVGIVEFIDFWAFLISIAILASLVILPSIFMQNIYCALGGIVFGGFSVVINIINLIRDPLLLLSFNSWENLIFACDILLNLGLVIFGIVYIGWYLRNSWHKRVKS